MHIPIIRKRFLLPLLKDFLTENLQFLKKNRQSYINLTKTWLSVICDETFKFSDAEVQLQLFDYFNDKIFDDEFICEHYKFLVLEALENSSEHAIHFAKFIFLNAVKIHKIVFPSEDPSTKAIYTRLEQQLLTLRSPEDLSLLMNNLNKNR